MLSALGAIIAIPGFASLVGAIIGALVKGVTDWQASQQHDATLQSYGQAQVSAAVNKGSADASARMAQSNAQPRDRASVLSRLDDGSA